MGKITFEYAGGKLEFEKDDRTVLEILDAYKARLIPRKSGYKVIKRYGPLTPDEIEDGTIKRLKEQQTCMISNCTGRGCLDCGKECSKYFPRIVKDGGEPAAQPPQSKPENTGKKKTMGRPPKYSEEVKQRVLELFGQKKKPQAIQKIILEEHGVEVKRNTMYFWRKGQRDSNPGKKEEPENNTLEIIHKIDRALEKPKNKYDGYKVVPKRDNDLKIVEDKVTCPKDKKAVDVEDCRSCGPYISIVRHTGTLVPHVRCTKAGS